MSLPLEEEGSSRPKLSLQPRSSSSGAPSPTSVKSTRPNPFGAARPKEQVIAEREGKKETEVLKEQASKEWKSQIVLSEAQREEKKAAEAELSFAQSELEKETDAEKAALLQQEVVNKEQTLEQLLASFEKLSAQPSPSVGPKHAYDRKRDEGAFMGAPMQYGGSYAGREAGFRPVSSYGETWGASRKSGKPSTCYTCGEVGHFSRDCPQGGSYNGSLGGLSQQGGSYGTSFGGGALFGGGSFAGKSGGRACYTCGQEGHFSRDCPQGGGGGYGPRGGGGYGTVGGGQQGNYEYGSGPSGYYGGNEYAAAAGYNGVANYGGRQYYDEGRR